MNRQCGPRRNCVQPQPGRTEQFREDDVLNAEARLNFLAEVERKYAEALPGSSIKFENLDAIRLNDGKVTGQIYALEVQVSEGGIDHQQIAKAVAEVLNSKGIKIFTNESRDRFFVKEDNSLGHHPERLATFSEFAGAIPKTTKLFAKSDRTPEAGATAWHELYCLDRGESKQLNATIFSNGTFGKITESNHGPQLDEGGGNFPLQPY